MAEEEGKVIQWPGGADEATDFDFLMVGKDGKPIMKIPKSKLNEVIVINGEGVKAVAGGATSATPTILRPGPTGANRKMEDVQGWFINGTPTEPPVATGTAWEAPAGKKNTNWWDGTAKIWSLGSSVPLPITPVVNKLTSTDKYSALSADTGRVLNNRVFSVRGVNFFSKKDVQDKFRIDATTGLLVGDGNSAVSNTMPVTAGKKYTIVNKANIGVSTVRYLNATGQPLKPLDENGVAQSNYSYSGTTTTAPVGAVALEYTVKYNNVSAGYDTLMVIEGTNTNIPYTPYELVDGKDVSGFDKKIDTEYLLNKQSVNIFNKATLVPNKIIRRVSGLIEGDNTSSVSDFIPAVEGKTYIKSGGHPTTFTHAFYDENYAPLLPLRANGTAFSDYSVPNNTPYKSPVGAKYQAALVKYNNADYKDTLQIQEGSVVTSYEPFQKKIGKEFMLPVAESEVVGLDARFVTVNANINAVGNTANSAVNIANNASDKADDNLDTAKSYTDGKVFGTPNINNGAITLEKISQSFKDYIDASGGGIITNYPDDNDLSTNNENQLSLKDGAEGYARIRNIGNYAGIKADLETKANTYGFIQIKDELDLNNAGQRGVLALPKGCTIRFVGKGMLKNASLQGAEIIIEAGRKKIFDNCELYRFVYNDQFDNAPGMDKIIPISTYSRMLFDFQNRVVINPSTRPAIDPNWVKPSQGGTVSQPVLEGGKWRYKVGGNVQLTFTDDGNGNIQIPKTKRFAFYNQSTGEGFPIDSFQSPINVWVSTIVNYTMQPTITLNCEAIFPEWFGAVADGTTDNTSAFNQAIKVATVQTGGATVRCAGNGKEYASKGGIFCRDKVFLDLNGGRIKLANNSINHLLIYDTVTRITGFKVDNGILEGNKANQTLQLDGIGFDWVYDQEYYSGYCWDDATITNLRVQNFSRDGIKCTTPGQVQLFGVRSYDNGRDGFSWDSEHFKLIECIAWGNGRYGAKANGNHWRIIGGAYAHNVGHNIYSNGGFEFQISVPSAIDSNTGNGIQLENCNQFTINGVRALQTEIGINIESSCTNGIISGCLVFSNRVDQIRNKSYTVRVVDCTGMSNIPTPDVETVTAGSISTGQDIYNLSKMPWQGSRSFLCAAAVTGLPSGTAPFMINVKASIVSSGGVVSSQRIFMESQDTAGVVKRRSLQFAPATGVSTGDTGWI